VVPPDSFFMMATIETARMMADYWGFLPGGTSGAPPGSLLKLRPPAAKGERSPS